MHNNEYTDILYHPDGREVIVWKAEAQEWLDAGFKQEKPKKKGKATDEAVNELI